MATPCSQASRCMASMDSLTFSTSRPGIGVLGAGLPSGRPPSECDGASGQDGALEKGPARVWSLSSWFS